LWLEIVQKTTSLVLLLIEFRAIYGLFTIELAQNERYRQFLQLHFAAENGFHCLAAKVKISTGSMMSTIHLNCDD